MDDSGSGSLRQAITEANANHTGTAANPDTINFDISGGRTIYLQSALPILTDIAVIDGTTEIGDYAQNLIGGNLGGGIVMNGTSAGTQVMGNLIGTDRSGQNALGNVGNGITISSSNNRVGAPLSHMGNVIAFNTQNGVAVDTGTSNALQENAIFNNAAQGIVLVNDGNDDQPPPVLNAAAQQTSTTVQITGTLAASANSTYTLEFFANFPGTSPDQGQTFLGSFGVTTNANGVATFSFNSPVSTPAGASFTATATDSANNTSAFSNAVFVQTPPSPPSPPAPPSAPAPAPPSPPAPIGRLVPFAFGFGAGLQLDVFDVDSQGQVFVEPLRATLFGGSPTFVNSDLIFSHVQLANGILLGLLQAQGGQLDLVQIVNIINPFAYNAVLTALMRPV